MVVVIMAYFELLSRHLIWGAEEHKASVLLSTPNWC